MRRIYIIIPVVLTLCFAGFAYWYSRGQAARDDAKREAALREYNAAIAAIYSGQEYVSRDGKKEAEADIAHGTVKLYLYGRTAGIVYLDEWAALLKERLGITLEPLAGCIVSEPLTTFADSYNARVRQYVAEKFGPTALEDVENEVNAQWKKRKSLTSSQTQRGWTVVRRIKA